MFLSSVPCQACIGEGRAVPSSVRYRGDYLCNECAVCACMEHYASLPKYDAEALPSLGSGDRVTGGARDVPVWAGNRQPASVDFFSKENRAVVTLHACYIGEDGRAMQDEMGRCKFSVSGKALRKRVLAMFTECAPKQEPAQDFHQWLP